MKLSGRSNRSRQAPVVYVIGAGITGCVLAERIASLYGRKVVICEKRKFIGGNSRAEIDPETGIEVHVHGSHIFHTKDATVWNYIRRFTEFTAYRHKVLLRSGGRVYSMPINLKTINDFYGRQFSPEEARDFLSGKSAEEGIRCPKNLEEQAVSFVGRDLYECMIKGYTTKQWGRDPKELPESIIKRLPVRFDYNADYFSAQWQGIPSKGYCSMFDALVANPLIEVRTGVDCSPLRESLPGGGLVIYTGPIDALFDYCHGRLEWRSLKFEVESIPVRDFQGTSVMNYGDPEVQFTRIHEFKHYHPEWTQSFVADKTIICREYPQSAGFGREAYYPVNDATSKIRLAKYESEIKKNPHLIACGRLGSYRYLDMDGAISEALTIAESLRPLICA